MYNETVKQHIYKWRVNNIDKYHAYRNNKGKEYYERDKEIILARKRENYEYKKFISNCSIKLEFEYLRNIELP